MCRETERWGDRTRGRKRERVCGETHRETGETETEGGSVKECVRRDRDMGKQKEGRKA